VARWLRASLRWKKPRARPRLAMEFRVSASTATQLLSIGYRVA